MKKIRYGVIGIKGFGYYHCHFVGMSGRAELTAVVDTDQGFARKRSEELGVRGFTNHRDMIDAGIVDAVSIVTPHHTHASIALECLEAGLHVFVEKPMANRVTEAIKMLEVAKAKKLKLCVGHQRRVYNSAKVLKYLIDSGAIGRVLRVLWTWNEFRGADYFERDGRWRSTWRQAGGGVLSNQVSHDLDLIGWLIGKPVRVSAIVANRLHDTEVEDMVGASVLFDNGALGSLQFTVNEPQSFCVRQIAGDKGIIVMPNVQSGTWDKDDEILLGVYESALGSLLSDFNGHSKQPGISWHSVKYRDGQVVTRRIAKEEVGYTIPKGQSRGSGLSLSGRLFRKLISAMKRRRARNHFDQNRPDPFAVLINSFINAVVDNGELLVTPESALATVEFMNAITLSAMRNKTLMLPIDHEEYDQLFNELARGDILIPRYR